MPKTEVVFFAEGDRSCPSLKWMDALPPKAQIKCITRVERLREMGYELRRPEADFLRDDIHELRVVLIGIQYRILYFFSEKRAVISHGFIKTGNEVPSKEIERAIQHKKKFDRNPLKHTYGA